MGISLASAQHAVTSHRGLDFPGMWISENDIEETPDVKVTWGNSESWF